jgi:hypothetical protein
LIASGLTAPGRSAPRARDDALFPITRSGALQDAWLTPSPTSIRGEPGATAGVPLRVVATTACMAAARGPCDANADAVRAPDRL